MDWHSPVGRDEVAAAAAREAGDLVEDNLLSDESIRSDSIPRRYQTYRIYEKPLEPPT